MVASQRKKDTAAEDISVVVVDDHELVRAGVVSVLNNEPGFTVIGDASSGEDLLVELETLRPKVVLMDVEMPGIGGLEATRIICGQYPSIKVVIITVHAKPPFPTRLLEAGARGYLSKDSSAAEMFEGIRTVTKGERYISRDIAHTMALSLLPGDGKNPFEVLSQREMQVMIMMVKGEKTRKIGEQLNLSIKTISTYRYRLFDKLKVANEAELTRLALRYDMVTSE